MLLGVTKERRKRKVKRNEEPEIVRMTSVFGCSTISSYRTHREIISLNTPSYVLPVAPGVSKKRGSEYIIEAQRLLTSSSSLCPDTETSQNHFSHLPVVNHLQCGHKEQPPLLFHY